MPRMGQVTGDMKFICNTEQTLPGTFSQGKATFTVKRNLEPSFKEATVGEHPAVLKESKPPCHTQSVPWA